MGLSPASSHGSASSGSRLYYEEIQAAVTVTATSGGSGNGTTIIAGASTAYTGVQVRIEFYAPFGSIQLTTAQNLLVMLQDGTTDLGIICNLQTDGDADATVAPFYGCDFITPSAGNHTYNIKAYKTSGSAVASIGAGVRGSGQYVPAFILVTTA